RTHCRRREMIRGRRPAQGGPRPDPHRTAPHRTAPHRKATMEISVQMYSVREALAHDVQGTVGRLVELGLTHAEPYQLLEYRDELVRAREQFPIDFPSAHQSFLGDVDFPAVLEAAQAVGVQYLIDPFWNPADWTDAGKLRALAETLNQRAAAAAEAGIRVGYHNHHFEL